MTTIINLTPHQVTILDDSGNIIKTYPSSRTVARCETNFEKLTTIDGVDVFKTQFTKVDGIPAFQENKFYIVSMVVAQALPYRKDLICPNTSPGHVVRGESGQIIGVKSFSSFCMLKNN